MEAELKVTESALGVHVLWESSARWSELHLDLKCTGFRTPCALLSNSAQERKCLIWDTSALAVNILENINKTPRCTSVQIIWKYYQLGLCITLGKFTIITVPYVELFFLCFAFFEFYQNSKYMMKYYCWTERIGFKIISKNITFKWLTVFLIITECSSVCKTHY